MQQDAPLAGKTLGECNLRARFAVYVLGVKRQGQFLPPPTARTVLQAGDRLLVRATDEALVQGAAACGLEILPQVESFPPTLLRAGLQMAEVAIAPRSSLAGKTVAEVDFFNRYGLRIFAINHRGSLKHYHLAEHRLGFGDALLVHGTPERIAALGKDEDFIVLEKTDAASSQPTLKPKRAFSP